VAGLSANVLGGVTLGGGTSPVVHGAKVAGQSPGSPYGAASTDGSDNSYLGSSPGHMTWYLGITAFVLLIAIRHSLPR